MAEFWQMTLMELDQDAVEPTKKLFHFGVFHYSCPICGEIVGIWRDPKIDRVTNGMLLQREKCKHGHDIDWSNVREANPKQEPCGRFCDCEWGSLKCFYKRGYMRDPETKQWLKNEDGTCMRTHKRECDYE